MSRSGEKKWKREWKWLKKRDYCQHQWRKKKEGKKQQQKTNQNDSEF